MLHRPSARTKCAGSRATNARSAGGSSGDRFCLSPGEGGQEKVMTLPRKHPISHALFYPQMY
jgi:hypothetical protein